MQGEGGLPWWCNPGGPFLQVQVGEHEVRLGRSDSVDGVDNYHAEETADCTLVGII